MNLLKILLSPIFWLLRKLAKVALILVIILAVVLASGNFWLPRLAKWHIRSRSGFEANIGSSRGTLFRGRLDFRDFDVSNPKDTFKTSEFFSFNELVTDVNLKSLLTDTVVVDEIVVDIGNVTLVKNADGVYNCQLFLQNMFGVGQSNGKEANSASSDKDVSRKKFCKKLRISRIVFAVKAVAIIDESTGSTREYLLNYRREFSNVDDINAIVKPLMADLGKYGLGIFIQSTLDMALHLPCVEQVTGGLIKVKDVSQGLMEGVGAGLRGIFGGKENLSKPPQ
ncbi:MAG: hypothetical protein LBD33_04040 [Puniceicoccales bacterium]|jgi:uncharacterized protein involved in outer membrane biogenesis|nr:hypothetical protein [Puniceicoccales bacterium]